MTAYRCPLCGNEMQRDLVLFLNHTNQHVIDRIKDAHPEWVASDGTCQPCAEYYALQLSGEGKKMNIGPGQQRIRVLMGAGMTAVSVALSFYLMASARMMPWGILLFIPIFIAALNFIQARQKTCAFLAIIGAVNLDLGQSSLKDPDLICQLRQKAKGILLQAAAWAGGLTLALFLFA